MMNYQHIPTPVLLLALVLLPHLTIAQSATSSAARRSISSTNANVSSAKAAEGRSLAIKALAFQMSDLAVLISKERSKGSPDSGKIASLRREYRKSEEEMDSLLEESAAPKDAATGISLEEQRGRFEEQRKQWERLYEEQRLRRYQEESGSMPKMARPPAYSAEPTTANPYRLDRQPDSARTPKPSYVPSYAKPPSRTEGTPGAAPSDGGTLGGSPSARPTPPHDGGPKDGGTLGGIPSRKADK